MIDLKQPLPLFEVVALGTIESKHGKAFTMLAGLDEDLVQQLRKYSLDESDTELQKGTRDKQRFGESSYEAWYAKERYPFVLIDDKKTLAAFLWFGPEALPDSSEAPVELIKDASWDTAGFRSYKPYRGEGLMRTFITTAYTLYHGSHPGKKLWIETNADNAAGLALYTKLGFVTYGRRTDNGRILLIK